MWDVVSAYFAGNNKLIGYDIFNEPWPGDIYTDIFLMVDQGRFDREYLYPLYQKVNAVIRKNDDYKIIFFEPAQVPDTMMMFVSHVGFPATLGGEAYKDREGKSLTLYIFNNF